MLTLSVLLKLALKSQVEEYSRRRADEEEVIRAAQEARQEQLRLHNQPSADEFARIQDRVTGVFKF